MSKPQAKTPVMILQEICAKKNPKDLPIYTEETETPYEYAESSMRFFIRCQALKLEAVGGGVTKKIAKHTAAEKVVNKFLKNEENDDVQLQQSVDTNCISDLMDYCVLKGYHKPEFTCISSCGPSHAPSFTFQCKLNSIERTETAGSKQLAKQLSAKAVLEVIKLSFPDAEKKLAVVNDNPQQRDATIRQKVTSYLDLKKKNKEGEVVMGTSIKNRHKFFRTQDAELIECLLQILQSQELTDLEKYEKLVLELETMWPVKIEKFLETDLMKFELQVDYEKFTCVLIGTKENLWREVLEYFCEMMNVKASETVYDNEMELDDVSIHSY